MPIGEPIRNSKLEVGYVNLGLRGDTGTREIKWGATGIQMALKAIRLKEVTCRKNLERKDEGTTQSCGTLLCLEEWKRRRE